MSGLTSNLTIAKHRASYAAISPLRPELSQEGRAVLITGSSSGIGFAIARSFAQASAKRVILTGRQQGPLNEAVTMLVKEFPQTHFIGHQIDISQTTHVESLWRQLDAESIVVDVLVLNAARFSPDGTMLDIGYRAVWTDFAANVGSNVVFVHLFYHQKKRDPGQKLALINVSTCAIHDFQAAANRPNYGASKCAGTIAVQQIAKDVSPDDLQVLSFHPGAIFTGAAVSAGYTPTSMDWDDEDLPGHYAVWAASDEAKFLHGRFTWAAWDVGELSAGSIRERIDGDTSYLKVGVVGL